MKTLITGAAGFIGAHLARKLISLGQDVVGLDNLNDYPDVSLKQARLEWIGQASDAAGNSAPGNFDFIKMDLADRAGIQELFAQNSFDNVVNLAAQAGVRRSINHPLDFIDSNVTGFAHILEGCRHGSVGHLLYASSSSVYGANKQLPCSTHANTDHPLSVYSATKKANELMAHSYSALFGLPTTGLRFFTVYGPWGRPDMAPMLFARAILAGESIDVFNHGNHSRDFTYIDDIIEGIVLALKTPPRPDPLWDTTDPDPATSDAPWRIYNIGNSSPVRLDDFIKALEDELGTKARKKLLPAQPGDVDDTWADTSDFSAATGFHPRTHLRDGTRRFVDWYKEFYKIR